MNPFSLHILLNLMLQTSSDVANQFNGYLILGYGAMWIIGIVYLITLLSRQRNLQQDVELMQQLLEEDEDSAV